MKEHELELLRYPIGRFEWVTDVPPAALENHIDTIREFPTLLDRALLSYTEVLLQKRYRPGGWTIAQLVHHLADSHIHSYVRFKHAVLESETPEIKDYNEDDWASTSDGASTDIIPSLQIIRGIHQRWASFLSRLQSNDFKKSYYHPQRKKSYPMDTATALYAWHGAHHIAHIQNALKQPFD